MDTPFWIDQNGDVYAGDKRNKEDLVAKPRPENGVWDQESKDWMVKPDPMAILIKIRIIFKQAIVEKPAIATPVIQKDLLKLSSVVERALELGLYEAAREAIKEPVLDSALELYRVDMLATIPFDNK